MKPVLIVGAGPVGMTMASELARYGVAVRIVDKAAQRTDKSKALVLWSRTLELLDRGGGSAPFVDAGFKAEAVNFIAGDKAIGRVSMESVQSPYPYGLMLPQSETERLLEERLRDLGISVERQVELTTFTSGDHGVEARLQHADGHEETVSADWLVGCDGAHSAVRHGLGATFSGETLNSDWMLADVHMEKLSSSRFRSVRLLASGWRSSFSRSPRVATSDLCRLASRPALNIRRRRRWNRLRPSYRPARAARGLGGLRSDLACGAQDQRPQRRAIDGAAPSLPAMRHTHSPAGGQGDMNTGMQDAFNLGLAKLALVVRKNMTSICSIAIARSAARSAMRCSRPPAG